MLEQIRNQVNQKLLKKNYLIVKGVYEHLLQSHNELCDCNYCDILSDYVYNKKLIHFLYKKYNEEYEFRDSFLLLNDIKNIEKENAKLKGQKDILKVLY